MEKRTSQQNKAMHVYFKQVADLLNAHGITANMAMADAEMPMDENLVKALFRFYGQVKSTSEMTVQDVKKAESNMIDHLNKYGIQVPWPSQDLSERLKAYEKYL